MNRATITTIFLSVACNQAPENTKLNYSSATDLDQLMYIDGEFISQKSSSENASSDTKSPQGGLVASDVTSEKTHPLTTSALEFGDIFDDYFEGVGTFSKQLWFLSEEMELDELEIKSLALLEKQAVCDTVSFIYGARHFEGNSNTGLFKMEIVDFSTKKTVDEITGKFYLDNDGGFMLSQEREMIASLTGTTDREDSSIWQLGTGFGKWTADNDKKGERFFIMLDSVQFVGFETLCD